jgi:hypothetical protein
MQYTRDVHRNVAENSGEPALVDSTSPRFGEKGT